MKLISSVIGCFIISSCTFAQSYIIVADRMIDCRNERAVENPVITIAGNRIIDIRTNQAPPANGTVINLKGYTLLPGLMDVHTHLLASGVVDYDKDLYENSPSYRTLRAVRNLQTALLNGFTTLRDVCSEGTGFSDVDLRRAIDSGFISGPRLFTSGKGIAATNRYVPLPKKQNWTMSLPSGTQYATGKDECIRAVREQISRGINWIKLYSDWGTPTFTFEEIQAVVNEAKKYNINVAAHATSKEGIGLAIEAGVRSIEHGDEFNDSLIQIAVQRHIYWSPTVSASNYFGDQEGLSKTYKALNKANKLKLKIVCGTDIGSFPWTINEAKELEYYVKHAGLSPMEAIKTATINTAELLGISNKLGSIEKGFVADIIAVRGNPLNDISLLQKVEFVMKDGKIFKQPGQDFNH